MNKLNKHFILLITLLAFGLLCNAQAFRPAGDGAAVRQADRAIKQPERIARRQNVVNPEILRIKKTYIAQQLNLPSDQNAKFLHKFEEYQEDYNSVSALIIENKNDFTKKMAYIEQIMKIQVHYYDEFVKIMSAEKAAKVFNLEKQFNLEAARISKEKKNPEDR